MTSRPITIEEVDRALETVRSANALLTGGLLAFDDGVRVIGVISSALIAVSARVAASFLADPALRMAQVERISQAQFAFGGAIGAWTLAQEDPKDPIAAMHELVGKLRRASLT